MIAFDGLTDAGDGDAFSRAGGGGRDGNWC